MSTYSKDPLSGSTHGRGILVAGTTSGTATTIHTGSATTTAGLGDFVTVYAMNNDSVSRILTLMWGGTSNPDDYIQQVLPAQSGLTLILMDLPIRNGLIVKAFASSANVISIHGNVKKIA